jgi:opacity protein-like surface antigen
MSFKAIVVALSLTATVPAFSQVAPSAEQGRLPFKVGGGFSDFQSSDGGHRLSGGAVWVDSRPTLLPLSRQGFGFEIESRYVTVGQSTSLDTGIFRQGTIGGGPSFTFLHFGRVHPYAKFLINFSGMDFNVGARDYTHETQVSYAPGGGVDYRLFSHLWARVDYEYQIWPDPFADAAWKLTPQGWTVGASWDFGSMHRR